MRNIKVIITILVAVICNLRTIVKRLSINIIIIYLNLIRVDFPK